MNRLDQLAQPIRRNGEHIRAIMERQRREQMEMMDETESLGGGRRSAKKCNAGSNSKMSRSMIHLAGDGAPRPKYNLGGGISTSFLPLGSGSKNACKSMTHLGTYNNAWSNTTPRSNLGLQTAATKKYLQSSLASSASNTFKRGQISNTNLYRFDTDSLLLMNSPSLLLNPGVCACLQTTTTTTTTTTNLNFPTPFYCYQEINTTIPFQISTQFFNFFFFSKTSFLFHFYSLLSWHCLTSSGKFISIKKKNNNANH